MDEKKKIILVVMTMYWCLHYTCIGYASIGLQERSMGKNIEFEHFFKC